MISDQGSKRERRKERSLARRNCTKTHVEWIKNHSLRRYYRQRQRLFLSMLRVRESNVQINLLKASTTSLPAFGSLGVRSRLRNLSEYCERSVFAPAADFDALRFAEGRAQRRDGWGSDEGASSDSVERKTTNGILNYLYAEAPYRCHRNDLIK